MEFYCYLQMSIVTSIGLPSNGKGHTLNGVKMVREKRNTDALLDSLLKWQFDLICKRLCSSDLIGLP